ncbi:hypothetical protein GCM10010911_38410 [Paenibacillus nasutitermitis]|uniref:Uncharacterized protein n=1 Tax=Paenibacillus nasutitermitis TaxID=1652958 RepID=A0A916Z518_9BACL|nr:hypothetical protein GCM10010911_38410 [Paenibacillus nasutitermitis]
MVQYFKASAPKKDSAIEKKRLVLGVYKQSFGPVLYFLINEEKIGTDMRIGGVKRYDSHTEIHRPAFR